jgi:hypothetical protein
MTRMLGIDGSMRGGKLGAKIPPGKSRARAAIGVRPSAAGRKETLTASPPPPRLEFQAYRAQLSATWTISWTPDCSGRGFGFVYE